MKRLLALTLAVAWVLASCQAPVTGASSPGRALTLKFLISGRTSAAASSARLLLPTAQTLTVTLTPSDSSLSSFAPQTVSLGSTASQASVDFDGLKVGTYAVSAQAFDASGTLQFEQSSTVKIVDYQANTGTLNLVPANASSLATLTSGTTVATSLAAGMSVSYVVPVTQMFSGGFVLDTSGTDAALTFFFQNSDGTNLSLSSSSEVYSARVQGNQYAFVTLYNADTSSHAYSLLLNPTGTVTVSGGILVSLGTYSALSFSSTSVSTTVGGTVSLSPTFTGGTNWNWVVNGTPSGTSSSFNFTPTTTGFYTISVTVIAGGVTYSGSLNVTVSAAVTVAMVSVPGGTFQRDSTSTNISTVSAFQLSRYDITQAQYTAVTGSDPSYYTGDTSRPVETVTWYDAVEFCNKLSTQQGLTPVYTITGRTPSSGYPITSATVTAAWTNNGYRLPTEMEYLWAAMGGASDAIAIDILGGVNIGGYSKAFAGSSGSNSMGDYAWYYGSGISTTQPVGTKTANELGLYDMTGNVWEWCWDWYDTYPSGAQSDYLGATSSTSRVVRSCSFNGSTDNVYALTFRTSHSPGNGPTDFGFRVARISG